MENDIKQQYVRKLPENFDVMVEAVASMEKNFNALPAIAQQCDINRHYARKSTEEENVFDMVVNAVQEEWLGSMILKIDTLTDMPEMRAYRAFLHRELKNDQDLDKKRLNNQYLLTAFSRGWYIWKNAQQERELQTYEAFINILTTSNPFGTDPKDLGNPVVAKKLNYRDAEDTVA